MILVNDEFPLDLEQRLARPAAVFTDNQGELNAIRWVPTCECDVVVRVATRELIDEMVSRSLSVRACWSSRSTDYQVRPSYTISGVGSMIRLPSMTTD